MTRTQAAGWLLHQDDFLILTHRSPDGDTIGSAAGLCIALREQGKTAYLLKSEDLTKRFEPYVEGLVLEDDSFVPKTVVSVDIASKTLLPDNAKQYEIDLNIDHHPSQEFFAKETLLESDKAATGEIIYYIVDRWGAVSKEVALPLYIAVSTDTGCFVYGNTTGDTHRVAGILMDTGLNIREINHTFFRTKSLKQLKIESMLVESMEVYDDGACAIVALSLEMMDQVGAQKSDIEDISSFVGQVEGVSTGVTLRQNKTGGWKLSLRTNPTIVNASDVCAKLGGGGHAAASGAVMENTSLEQAKSAVLKAIEEVQNKKMVKVES